MSTLRQIAELIPAEYRKEILELNMVTQAIAVNYDPTMMYLCVIWKDYIEHDFQPDCNLCCGRVLDSFKAIQPVMIEMEKESKLLEHV